MDSTPAVRDAVDVADDTFVVCSPAEIAEQVHDPTCWQAWWPDLQPTVTADRGLKGIRWSVRGAVLGSMEIWLEPWGDGVIVHWYLRARPARVVRHPERERAKRVVRWKEQVHALKDRLEAGREPGSPRLVRGPAGVKDHDDSAESQ
jgi:hypothetical protein